MKKYTQNCMTSCLFLLFLSIFTLSVYAENSEPSATIPLNGHILNFKDPKGPFKYTTKILTYKTSDNASIEATLVIPKSEAPKSGIVFVHMWARDRMTFWGLPEYLATYGYTSIYMDLRGHGNSSFPDSTEKITINDKKRSYKDLSLDIIPAFKILNQQKTVKPDHLILIAASLGCPLGLNAAQYVKESITGMIFLAPAMEYFDVHCYQSMNELKDKPSYVIADKEDGAYHSAINFFNHFECYKTFFRLNKVGHGTDILFKDLGFPTLIREWVVQINQNSSFFQKLSNDKINNKE